MLPTRNGRNATCLTATGPVKLRNACHKQDLSPIEAGCDCLACTQFLRGYLRHLFLAGEMLGPILASLHNLSYMHRLTRQIRAAIAEGRFSGVSAGSALAGPLRVSGETLSRLGRDAAWRALSRSLAGKISGGYSVSHYPGYDRDGLSQCAKCSTLLSSGNSRVMSGLFSGFVPVLAQARLRRREATRGCWLL